MYIYNVTINVEDEIHDTWLEWMKNQHIPDMLATGKFLEAKMSRVMVQEETGGSTYSIQYGLSDSTTLEAYYKEDAARLRQDGVDRFGGKFVAFRTELEVLDYQRPDVLPATEQLFTYGTLQNEEVQMAVFRRKLVGDFDALPGYQLATELVAGRYPLIERGADDMTKVRGMVFEVSGDELRMADAYEGGAYKRIKVTLDSGKPAWVFVRNTGDS